MNTDWENPQPPCSWVLTFVKDDGRQFERLVIPDLIRDPWTRQHTNMSKQPCVYILASRRNGTTYIGVTSDLLGRLYQHRTGTFEGFASEHRVWRLVHFEMFDDMYTAITREKQLKNWRRAWKVALIEEHNPFWEDRAVGLGFDPLAPYPATLKPSSRA